MLDLILNSALTHSLLLVAPIIGALLLRWARCPGWSILGGVLAGVLLGPTILGRVAPDAFERHFIGAVEVRQQRDDLFRRQQADILAAMQAGTRGDALDDLRRTHQLELAEADRDLADARWSFQRPFRSYVAAIIVLTLLGGGLLRVGGGATNAAGAAPLSIGGWAALLPGGLATAALMGFFDVDVAPAVMVGAAVAIGPLVLPRADREAADQAERGGAHLVQMAGRVASVMALLAVAWSLWAQRGFGDALWAMCLFALPLGWALPRKDTKIVRGVVEIALVPGIAACVALRVELIRDFAIWPLVIMALLSGDGRWIGALIGALLPGGRKVLRTMRLVLGSMACGPTQLAVAALAIHTWTAPASSVLGLIVGAVLIEVTAPMRRVVGRQLIEAEEELERMEDEGS